MKDIYDYEWSWAKNGGKWKVVQNCYSVYSFLPSFLPSCLPSFLHAFLPAFLPSFFSHFTFLYFSSLLNPFLAFLPAFLPSFLPACLPSCLPSFLPSFLHSFLHAFLPAFLPSSLTLLSSISLPYLILFLPSPKCRNLHSMCPLCCFRQYRILLGTRSKRSMYRFCWNHTRSRWEG